MDEDKSAKAIYHSIKRRVLKRDSDLEKNFIGLVTDQAATLVGVHKGLFKRLKKDYPYIIGTNDLSHVYHLITKHSIRKYPSRILQIVRDVTGHFSNSCQRRAKFRTVQLKMDYPKAYDIKSYTRVRWLSLAASLSRIMDLWEPLQIYFAKYGEEGELEHFTLENEVYLRNLLCILELLVHYNLECQKQKLLYDQMLLNIQESLVIFAKMVIPPEKLQSSFEELDKIPFLASEDELRPFIISVEEFAKRWIEEHSDIEELFLKLDLRVQQQIMQDTMDLILKVLAEIKKRLPLENRIIQQAQVVFLGYWDAEHWRALSRQFTNLISEEDLRHFNRDLLRMEINFRKHSLEHERSGRSILETWNVLSNPYPYLAQLAKGILVLPSSTVPVERVFSQMQDFKTPKRNRLNIQNIESSLLIYQANGSMEFDISSAMLSKYDSQWKDEEKSEGDYDSERELQEERIEEKKEEQVVGAIMPHGDRRTSYGSQLSRSDLNDDVKSDQFETLSSPLSQLASYQQLTSLMSQLLFSPPPKDLMNAPQSMMSQLSARSLDWMRSGQDLNRANSQQSDPSQAEITASVSQKADSSEVGGINDNKGRLNLQTEQEGGFQEISAKKIEEEENSKENIALIKDLDTNVIYKNKTGSLKRSGQGKSNIGQKKVYQNNRRQEN